MDARNSEENPMLSPPKTPIFHRAAASDVADLNIERNTPEDSRRSWLKIKFCQVYFLLVLIAALVFAILIFCVVFASKFHDLSGKYEKAIERSDQLIGKMVPLNYIPPNEGQTQFNPQNDQYGVPSREEYDEMNGFPPPIKPVTVSHQKESGKESTRSEGSSLGNGPVKREDTSMERERQEIEGKAGVPEPSEAPKDTYVPPMFRKRYKEADPYRWYREGGKCGRMDHCPKSSFLRPVQPPLVVVSFDGFAKRYEQRRIVKNLELMKECGASSEFVLPSYPSKTFPNHWTIATGLYPGVHGLVDNNFYDPSLSGKIIDTKSATQQEIYGADPIWSIYKRTTGRRTGCMMWVGCSTHEDNKPDFVVPFNTSISDSQKIDMVVDWLSLPEAERPGLVMLYFMEPDDSAHWRTSKFPLVNESLHETDQILGRFLNALHDKRLLDCTNLVVLSDHGMSDLWNHIDVRDKMADESVVFVPGTLGHVYLEDGGVSQEEIRQRFDCDDGTNYLIYNKTSLPPRYHYANNPRVGDVFLDAAPGTMFRLDNETSRAGDHGYDYLEESMRTVFYGRGPSFRRGAVAPPFQNVEYLNLFAALLGLPATAVPQNNGTHGALDSVLESPPHFRDPLYLSDHPIPECPRKLFAPAIDQPCGNCTADRKNCLPKPHQSVRTKANGVCAKQICDLTVIVRKEGERIRGITSLQLQPAADGIECPFVRDDYFEQCPSTDNSTVSLSSTGAEMSYGGDRIPLNAYFRKEILSTLDELTAEYATNYGPLLVISGAFWENTSEYHPSHFYRILLSCGGEENWDRLNRECRRADDGRVLSFLIPHLGSDWNCASPRDRLLKYTARIRDIEVLSGIHVFRDESTLSYEGSVKRKTHVPVELWYKYSV